MVSAYLPQQLEELEQIPGFGVVKVRDFGEEIIQIAKQYARTTDFPLDWVADTVSEPEFARWVYAEWEAKQANELAKISERRLLMEGLQQGMGIGQLMDRLQVDRRELIMRIEKIAKEGGAIEGLAEEELASMPPVEREAVESALIELGTSTSSRSILRHSAKRRWSCRLPSSRRIMNEFASSGFCTADGRAGRRGRRRQVKPGSMNKPASLGSGGGLGLYRAYVYKDGL